MAAMKGNSKIVELLLKNKNKIDDSLFKDCIAISEILIPSSIKTIGFNAFEKCLSLTKVIFESLSENTLLGILVLRFISQKYHYIFLIFCRLYSLLFQ